MRVALACAPALDEVRALAAALSERGVEVDVVAPPAAIAPVEAMLRWRGFEDHLAAIPFARGTLARADVVHAFTLPDAFAAVQARRPLALHFHGPVGRENVAARRLRLKFLRAALEANPEVTAQNDGTAASVERWLGVQAQVLDPSRDADGFVALYQKLYTRR